MMSGDDPRTVMVLCEACDGEGQTYTSRYGGNDPDVWPVGRCAICNGTAYVDVPDELIEMEDLDNV